MVSKGQEWPAMHEWPAERVTPGDVIYGERDARGYMSMYQTDEVFRVTSVHPGIGDRVKLSGVTLEGLDTWILPYAHTGVAIKKGK